MAKIKAKLWRRQILELEQLFYVLWLRIEVEKFNFREHLIKFSLLPPWVQNKTLKLYKSHQFKLCCKKSSRYCNKKMVFNQLKCIIYTNVIIWYLLAAIPSVEVLRAKNTKNPHFPHQAGVQRCLDLIWLQYLRWNQDMRLSVRSHLEN